MVCLGLKQNYSSPQKGQLLCSQNSETEFLTELTLKKSVLKHRSKLKAELNIGILMFKWHQVLAFYASANPFLNFRVLAANWPFWDCSTAFQLQTSKQSALLVTVTDRATLDPDSLHISL